MKSKLLRAMAVLASACPFVVLAASEARESVLASDAAFAALSVERGSQQALQAWLAGDGIVFRPTAVVGREWLATHEQASGRLEWRPAAAAVDCTGRLAATTGPWVYANSEGGEPASGHYLSLWRRDDDGEWSVVLDHAIDHVLQAEPSGQLQVAFDTLWPSEAPRDCGKASDANAEALAKADRRLNAAIRSKGIDAALRQFAEAGAVAYRDDSPPRPLAADWPTDGVAYGGRLEGRAGSAIADPASDMGYTYGEVVEAAKRRSAAKVRAVYVRVWRHDGREWHVGLDMLTPVSGGE